MDDLVVDPQIRTWVFLPIVIITFLFGMLRHYALVAFSAPTKVSPEHWKANQILIRSTVLRDNCSFIPNSSFLMRKHHFNHHELGYLTQKKQPAAKNAITDPSLVTDLLKGNLTNVLPMILIGGWINWMFSGFILTKVPFPLTLRFKPMLQKEIELAHLDAAWVSSASWYFLNVFGLRSVYVLVLGEGAASDQAQQLQEQMSGSATTISPDYKFAFKSEWEALEIIKHKWNLYGIENCLF